MPNVSATVFIGNRPSATRSAAISVFLSPLWKGFAKDFDLHRLTAEHALQLADAIFQLHHFRIADHRLVRIHGCRTSLAQKPVPSRKQIGRNAMTASGGRYRFAWFETLLNNCQLLLGCPPSAAHISRQRFNLLILVRHKPVLRAVLAPFCLS